MSEHHADPTTEAVPSIESYLVSFLHFLDVTRAGVQAQLRALRVAQDEDTAKRVIAALGEVATDPPPLDTPGFFERRLAELERQ